MKLSEIRTNFHRELAEIYSESEIDTLFYWVAEKIIGKPISMLKLAIDENWPEVEKNQNRFLFALLDLKKHKPIQYIVGEAEFYGKKFFVNSHTLIPRPETEELIEWVLSDIKNDNLKILDIGTGTGCIPIILKLERSSIEIQGMDISEEALKVAKTNAEFHQVDVSFLSADFLKMDFSELPEWDVIISNPPYIGESEKIEMDANVLDFEPHQALFVPDKNPLIFYKRILDLAQQKLTKNGSVYLEINQKLGKETKELFETAFQFVELKKDLSGNYRMIKAENLK